MKHAIIKTLLVVSIAAFLWIFYGYNLRKVVGEIVDSPPAIVLISIFMISGSCWGLSLYHQKRHGKH